MEMDWLVGGGWLVGWRETGKNPAVGDPSSFKKSSTVTTSHCWWIMGLLRFGENRKNVRQFF